MEVYKKKEKHEGISKMESSEEVLEERQGRKREGCVQRQQVRRAARVVCGGEA